MTSQAQSSRTFADVDLHIFGIGVEYPEARVDTQFLKEFAAKFYPSTPAWEKVLAISSKTGIDSRACAIEPGNPIMYGKDVPTVDQQGKLFIETGTKIVAAAARKAIQEWGGGLADITHVVATSSTAFTNPGYDFFLVQELGLRTDVERTLVHGVGCSGGMAALRVAANLACGSTSLGHPARILVVCLEMSTLCTREELDLIHERQEVRIPITLFGDAATALIVGNGVGLGSKFAETPVYNILGWDHRFVPETSEDITYHVQANGWEPTLSHRVPTLTSTAVQPIFEDLVTRIATLPAVDTPHAAQDFDWAVHPGGLKVITEVQNRLRLTPDHLRASYCVYKNYGNTSSATIFSVLNQLRHMGEGRDNIVACAFGPGITVETCVLRRQRQSSTAESRGWGCTIA